ncbi:hypothetical protein [Corynebacterium sputi]|uniref:hypothetical protein n=1 Tax=Corynebacterium sputi TaxID=489915 RepID=UPI00040FB0D5|nr:hypothetical protein [Corynebacterium sputi]
MTSFQPTLPGKPTQMSPTRAADPTRQEATEYFDDMYAEFYGVAPLVERRRKGLSE